MPAGPALAGGPGNPSPSLETAGGWFVHGEGSVSWSRSLPTSSTQRCSLARVGPMAPTPRASVWLPRKPFMEKPAEASRAEQVWPGGQSCPSRA